MQPRFHLLLLPVLVLTAAQARADVPAITANTHTLQADADNQVISLAISGTDAIAGEDLSFQINDGTFGPLISRVDILSGTLFDGNNNGDEGGHAPTGVLTSGPYANRLAVLSTTTTTGTVIDNGLLAQVTIDTRGLSATTFELILLNTTNGDSRFISFPSLAVITPTFADHQFAISVPEPASLAFMTLPLALLLRRKSRRPQATAQCR